MTAKTDLAKTAPARAARDFTDAGTGRSFAKGKPVDAAEGEIANYRAAGLLALADENKAPTADA